MVKSFIRTKGFRPKVPPGLASFLVSRLFLRGPCRKENEKVQRYINQRVYSSQISRQFIFFARGQYALRNYNVSGDIASTGLFLRSPYAKNFFKEVVDDVWNALLENFSPLRGSDVMDVIYLFNSKNMTLMLALAKLSGYMVSPNLPSPQQILQSDHFPKSERFCYVMGIDFFSRGNWDEGFACLRLCSFPQAKLAIIRKSLNGYGNLLRPNVINMLKSLAAEDFEPAKLFYVHVELESASGVDSILRAIQEFDQLFPDGHPSFQNLRPNFLKRLSVTRGRARGEVVRCTYRAETARECATVSNERLLRNDSDRNRARFQKDEDRAVRLEAIAAQKTQELDAQTQQVIQVMALLRNVKEETKAAAKEEAKAVAKRVREEAKAAVKREKEDANSIVKRAKEETIEAKAASKKARREE